MLHNFALSMKHYCKCILSTRINRAYHSLKLANCSLTISSSDCSFLNVAPPGKTINFPKSGFILEYWVIWGYHSISREARSITMTKIEKWRDLPLIAFQIRQLHKVEISHDFVGLTQHVVGLVPLLKFRLLGWIIILTCLIICSLYFAGSNRGVLAS